MLKYPLVALVFTRKGRSVGGTDVSGKALKRRTAGRGCRFPLGKMLYGSAMVTLK
jgi:hypothetical protein